MQSVARELFGEDINLTERSPLGMFLQANAWEISEAWEEIEKSHYNSFALDSTGIALDKAVSNFGRDRFLGTKATGRLRITGTIGTVIPKGFLVSTDNNLIYETLEEVILLSEEEHTDIKAMQEGKKYNNPQGAITIIVNPISGVSRVYNPSATTGGSDIETDEALRLRHLETLREPLTGDNVAQYKLWTREIKGVGGIKVLSTTPSKGYVTIIITDEDGKPANQDLISQVEQYIDLVKPVNAGVIVQSATTKPINIKFNIQLAEGYSLDIVEQEVERAMIEFFTKLSLEETYVSYAQIGRTILSIKGIFDYSNLTLNGNAGNVTLGDRDVATLGTLELIE